MTQFLKGRHLISIADDMNEFPFHYSNLAPGCAWEYPLIQFKGVIDGINRVQYRLEQKGLDP